jgi:competence protein ComEC
MNRFAAALVALASFGCRSAPPGAPAPVAAVSTSTLRVHCIDVGQGAATLFEFADGAVLVDTGGEENAAVHSDAMLGAYLDDFFVHRPDLHGELAALVLTHPHIDHTRGVTWVLAHHPPRNIVTDGLTVGSGSEQQNELKRWAGEHHVPIREMRLDDIPARGLTDGVIDPVHGSGVDPVITALWGQVSTDPGWGTAFNKPRFTNCNNHSLVLRVDFGKASVLVTGDLEDAAIPGLIKRYEGTGLLDVDVYVVGHHGSINGTTPEFVAAMSPEHALINVGKPDHQAEFCALKFGHPRAEVIAMLEAGVHGMRRPVEAQVGKGAGQFESRTVTHAIYATGWDGNVVLEAKGDGSISVPSVERALAGVGMQ